MKVLSEGGTVASYELLARYILSRRDVRRDNTLRADPFIPYKYVELSVTRHGTLTEAELWQRGEVVARLQAKVLHGRGDTAASFYTAQGLKVVSAPVAGNPEHANVVGWPPDKPSQKVIALQIVKQAKYVPKPVGG